MPYASKAQQRLFHAKEARGEISAAKVHEYDEATKNKPGGFKSLPERLGKKKKPSSKAASSYFKRMLSK